MGSIKSSMMDSGLIIVIIIIVSLLLITFSFLIFVDYEWCHVLYKNNTENPACTKNNNRDKLLLSNLGEQMESMRRREMEKREKRNKKIENTRTGEKEESGGKKTKMQIRN